MALYVAPGATFTAVAEGFGTGLASSLTVQLEASDGSTYRPATNDGIVEIEAGSGTYAKSDLLAPSSAGTYVLLWSDGTVFASEELIVTSDAATTVTSGTGDFTFGLMRSYLDDLAGVDLDDDQRDDLLNQAHRELAVRSEWYRAAIVIPGVTDQTAYSLPSDVYRILNLRVDGEAYKPSFEQQADRLRRGTDTLLVAGIFWMSWGSANERQFSIYPTIATGTDISLSVIERPALMTDDADVPVVPEEFRQAIVDRAVGIALGLSEDNPDLRSYHEDLFDRKVGELRRLTYSTGRDVTFWGAA